MSQKVTISTTMPGETKTVLSLNAPTPNWVRVFVRACTWITAIWALLALFVDLRDFGVPELTASLILKYMSGLTGMFSVIARFIGIKPIAFNDQD